MEYRIGNKKVRLNPYHMKYSKSLGNGIGTTADVYLIDGKAYKLYRPYCRIAELMTKDKVDYFKDIPTKRIILPDESILDKKRNLRGYISNYIEDLGYDNLLNLDRADLIEELKILRDDFILLGNYGVLVCDSNLENTVFHDGCSLIDCGRYLTGDETGYDRNISISCNLDEFSEYFVYQIMGRWMIKNNYHEKLRELKKEYFSVDNDSMINYLEDDMVEDNLGQYLKRKVS